MGKNSQRRRADKQRRAAVRRRDHQRPARGPRDEPPGSPPPSLPGPGFESGSEPCDCGSCRTDRDSSALASWCAESESRLMALLAHAAWARGWQPAELVRHVRRQSAAPTGAIDLLRRAIGADASCAPLATHPMWTGQVERLCVGVPRGTYEPGWVERWFVEQADAREARAALGWLPMWLTGLRALPKLLPPPGEEHCDLRLHVPTASATSDAKHAQIRALLSKAESTPYPAEADAFTSKAQEMMTALQIDDAVLRATTDPISGPRRGEASAVRVPIDEPYLTEKAILLSRVASANDAHVVTHRNEAMCTVVGPVDQLRPIELLYTSLLIQVQAALTAEAEQYRPGDPRRGRRFRGSFIAGYAARIGERLERARAEVVDSVANAALPVLAADRSAADELLEQLFRNGLSEMRRKHRDLSAFRAGAAAADRAHLRDGGLSQPGGDGRDERRGRTLPEAG